MSSSRTSRLNTDRRYVITRRDQVSALASAVRQEIIDTVQAAGPRSAAELAHLMGRPADALYYHIKRLLKVGLLVVASTRISGRRDEAVFDLVGHPLVLKYPPGATALVRAMVRTAERDFRSAVSSERARVEGSRRNLWAGRRHAWLSSTDLVRVNRHLDRLIDIMTRARKPAGGELCTLTLILAPRESRGRRRASR